MKLIRAYASWFSRILIDAVLVITTGDIVGVCVGYAGIGSGHRSLEIAGFSAAGALLLWGFVSGSIAFLCAPRQLSCKACLGRGYLINIKLRVLEDCALCQATVGVGTAPVPAKRNRPSALSERSSLA